MRPASGVLKLVIRLNTWLTSEYCIYRLYYLVRAAGAAAGFDFVGEPQHADTSQQHRADQEEAVVVGHHIRFAPDQAIDRFERGVVRRVRVHALADEGLRHLVDAQLGGG